MDTWRVTVHKSCGCNELRGLVGRVLGVVPSPDQNGLARVRIAAMRIAGRLRGRRDYPVLPYESVLTAYSGAKRRKYERAAVSLDEDPLSKKDAKVTAFVKAEKRVESDLKDPRIIQMRNARFTLKLATYLKPLEHALLGYKGRTRVARRSRVIAKGLDTWQHAALIVRKFQTIGECVVLSIDAKRFDKHVSRAMLEIEHGVWSKLQPDPELARILKWQLVNKGVTMRGHRYKVTGNRMSGDYNTGAGNCLIVSSMIEACLVSRGIKFDYLVNSDDALIFLEKGRERDVAAWLETDFRSFGFEVVAEKPAYKVEDIVHCQQHPVLVDGRWRMVRQWEKVISQAFCGVNHFHEPVGGLRVVKSVAQAELSLSSGVPILQPFFMKVLEILAGIKFAALDQRDSIVFRSLLETRGMTLEREWQRPITCEARESFGVAFGVSWDQQRTVEAAISKLSLEDFDLRRMDWAYRSGLTAWLDTDASPEELGC